MNEYNLHSVRHGAPRPARGRRVAGPVPKPRNNEERHWAVTTIVAVAGIAVAVASTAASLYVADQQADTQAKFQKAAVDQRDQEIEENYKLSIASMHDAHKAQQARILQEGEYASGEEQRNAIEAAEARGTARVAAGEAGVSGLSVNALLDDFRAQEARYSYGTRRNLGISTENIEADMIGARATAQGRSNSIPRLAKEPINRPGYLGAALRIGGDALGAYSKYRTPKTDTPGDASGVGNYHGAY